MSSRLLHEGRNFDFLVDEVAFPNGHVTQRDIVRHPGHAREELSKFR